MHTYIYIYMHIYIYIHTHFFQGSEKVFCLWLIVCTWKIRALLLLLSSLLLIYWVLLLGNNIDEYYYQSLSFVLLAPGRSGPAGRCLQL